MAERLTKQPFQIHSMNLQEINDVLRRIQDELDRLAGLRGVITVYDSEQYRDTDNAVVHGWGAKP